MVGRIFVGCRVARVATDLFFGRLLTPWQARQPAPFPLDCVPPGVFPVLDLQPRGLRSRSIRCIGPLRADALVIVGGDCTEQRFAVRLDVLHDLNAGGAADGDTTLDAVRLAAAIASPCRRLQADQTQRARWVASRCFVNHARSLKQIPPSQLIEVSPTLPRLGTSACHRWRTRAACVRALRRSRGIRVAPPGTPVGRPSQNAAQKRETHRA